MAFTYWGVTIQSVQHLNDGQMTNNVVLMLINDGEIIENIDVHFTSINEHFTIISEHFSRISSKYTIIRSSDHHWEAAPTAIKYLHYEITHPGTCTRQFLKEETTICFQNRGPYVHPK